MRVFRHQHVTRKIGPDNPLYRKVVYVPAMSEGHPEAFASVFRWLGVEASPTPPSDARTRELGGKFTAGDECYPAKVTVGDFLRIMERPGFDPQRTVFFMAAADGPCRFGQYAPYLKRLLSEVGHGDIQVLSPSSKNGYADIGDIATPFMRAAWRALVCGDLLHKALLKTRPHEDVNGSTDQVFQECIRDLCRTIEASCAEPDCQLSDLVESMRRARERFRRLPAHYDPETPLIGVVGEIFCRLNTFSNEDLIRKLESYGAEAWLSDITEWIGYSNQEVRRKLRLCGRGWSLEMLKAGLREHVQHSDEHALRAPFREDWVGYEEPEIAEVLELGAPYLPHAGAEGEMALSAGKAVYLAQHGADGIIDISPFTCMNGIVSESVYPKLSKDHGGIPIRNFYFDGTQSDLDRDLGIYMELARSYGAKKRYPRHYPAYFGPTAAA